MTRVRWVNDCSAVSKKTSLREQLRWHENGCGSIRFRGLDSRKPFRSDLSQIKTVSFTEWDNQEKNVSTLNVPSVQLAPENSTP